MKRTAFKPRKTPMKRSPMKRGTVRLKKVRDVKSASADKRFSLYIRRRDKHCRYPNCFVEKTDCSHFFERHHSGTRYDPKNCIALCRDHHTEWERRKKHEYYDFMVEWLGMDEYMALQKRAWSYKNRLEAAQECVALLSSLDTSTYEGN